MKPFVPILTITGSDTTGGAGVQADIQTITAMGGNAASVITTITSQNSQGIQSIFDLPTSVVRDQLLAIKADLHPRAIKVGMVRSVESIQLLRQEIVGCPLIVSAPGLLNARGFRLMDDASLTAYVRDVFPLVKLLVLKCSEAELILGQPVEGTQQMLQAAQRLLQMGPEAVLLRGGHFAEGQITSMLLLANAPSEPQFFSSPNREGWQMHGVGGTLSSAIATRLALGDDILTALHNAHTYLRSQVVYSVGSTPHSIRQVELYNRLMELIASSFRQSRDVSFYASQLSVTPRYLSEVTGRIVGKSPKQLIADYVTQELERALQGTSLNIQELAHDFGFSSQAALAKFFRQQKGCSPTDYRSQ